MNGKLYIEDPLTGDVIKIADSMGAGWNLANSLSFDKLAEFLANHDSEASYGACNFSTALRLVTEHEIMARSEEGPDSATAERVDDPLADVARAWARRATCPDLQVGCVIARRGHQLTAGYNGAPRGARHCRQLPKTGVCEANAIGWTHAVVHAEANAVAQAAREGISLEGSTCIVTHRPCLKCAMLLGQAGVESIIWLSGESVHEDNVLREVCREMGVSLASLIAEEEVEYVIRAEP
jgi:dCMP deaminase